MTIRHDVGLAIRKDLGDYDALREIISAQCSAVNIADLWMKGIWQGTRINESIHRSSSVPLDQLV